MRGRDLSDLLFLAILWGSIYLFIKVSVDEFGTTPLIAIRTLLGAAVLTPFMFWFKKWPFLVRDLKGIAIVSVLGVALPFLLLAYASKTLPSGYMSILSAVSPLWAGVIAWVWLKDKLPFWRIVGLCLGFAGILLLVWNRMHGVAVTTDVTLAILAGLTGPFLYSISVIYTKKHLMHCDPLAAAMGSLLIAGLIVLPFAWNHWPTATVPKLAWAAAIVLAVGCTAIGYIVYYRFQLSVGPSRAVTVTFLMPVFAVFWGWLLLDETVSVMMLAGAGVILLGTALAIGLLPWRKQAKG